MSKEKKVNWNFPKIKQSARDDNRPIELRKKPVLSITWKKAKELFDLED